MKPSGEAYSVEQVAANRLAIDHSYQRDPQKAHYRRIAAELDFDALGVFVVSKRADGHLIVIDGQHRLMALHEQNVAEWEVLCRVYSGLTLEREARMYRDLNKTRKPSAWDDFKAGLVQGDPECLNIRKVAAQAGWTVDNQSTAGKVCCISTLRAIYRKPGGLAVLLHALEDANAAWGDNPAGVERYILAGLAMVHQLYGKSLERPTLIKKLAKAKGGPAGILGTAKQLADLRAQPLARLCASVMVEHYNRGRRTDRLAEL